MVDANEYKPVDDLPLTYDDQNVQSLRPFLKACSRGNLLQVKYLVQDQDRNPAYLYEGLLRATRKSQAHVVRYLLETGAPITRNVQRLVAEFACSPTSEEGTHKRVILISKL